MKSSTRANWFGRNSLGGLVLGLVLAAIAALIFTQRILIVDSIRAWAYTPSAAIATIDERVGFTGEGTRLFYASTPELNATSSFNSECNSTEKTSVVLGCYASGRIYLYEVTNKELDGIEEVTAAHETLHAAYERLGSAERKTINALLQAEANKLLKDSDFKERMSVYAKLPEADRINELHSVIGTEVANIDPSLEHYYKRYFTDRSKIVELYKKYHGIFVKLQNQAEALAKSLDQQALAINAQVEQYNADADALDKDIKTFNSRASGSYFKTQEQFDTARAELVSRSAALEGERRTIDAAIQAYNTDKKKFDGLASHLTELNNSIDSSLAPPPAVSGTN